MDADTLLRTACGLVDRSERGKLLLTGADAKEFLHGQVTNDIGSLEEGGGCYAAFLTHKGKMLGDMRVLDGGSAGLWLDCERSVLQALFTLINRFKIGRDVEIEKRTLQRSLLSLVGPDASRIAGIEAGPEHSHVRSTIGGVSVRAVITDAGVDVICDAAQADVVRSALGVPEVPEAAAEVLRVEAGRPRYGLDLDESVIPQEAALNERAVSFTKGCYVGQETVARLFYKGKPNRHLRGLKLSSEVSPGTELVLGEKVVGKVATSVVSPVHGPIALAIVRREASVGDVVAVGGDGGSAKVVELPFAVPVPAISA